MLLYLICHKEESLRNHTEKRSKGLKKKKMASPFAPATTASEPGGDAREVQITPTFLIPNYFRGALMALFQLFKVIRERKRRTGRGRKGGRIRFPPGGSGEEGGQLVPDPGSLQARGVTAALSLAGI